MRKISRPFFALIGWMICTSALSAQSSPAMRAHRHNTKHTVQAQRLESQREVREASLTPYQKRIVLRKKRRKGTHGLKHRSKKPRHARSLLYLEFRRSSRSTSEPLAPNQE